MQSIGERVRADLGAQFNNLFNRPLFSPDQGGESIANLGDFNIHVDPVTKRMSWPEGSSRRTVSNTCLTSESAPAIAFRCSGEPSGEWWPV